MDGDDAENTWCRCVTEILRSLDNCREFDIAGIIEQYFPNSLKARQAMFRDCLGREIKVGDVLAIGHREGDRGAICLAVVTGLDSDKAIKVIKYQRGKWRNNTRGDGKWNVPCDGDIWKAFSNRCPSGSRCFVTGMSEHELGVIMGICGAETGNE